MKKMYIAVLAAALVLISGCSANSGVTETDNGYRIEELGVSVACPEGWEALVGDELYEAVYNTYNDGFESPEDMKELMTLDGLQYLLYLYDEDTGSAVTVSVQDMTVGEEDPTAEEYARSVHDTALFTYMANGYTTNGTGNFSEVSYSGLSGYLSEYQLFDPNDDSFMLGGAEFMTESGNNMYSFQAIYGTQEAQEQTLAVLSSIVSG